MTTGRFTGATAPGRPFAARARLLAVVPIILLAGALALFAQRSDQIFDLLGGNPPPADQVDVRRVAFKPGQIEIRVTNPQTEALTIALVSVDDAFLPFTIEGSARLGRLDSRTITIPYQWDEGEPYVIGLTSANGVQTTEEVPAAVAARGATARGFGGYALIGGLVGLLPVALGMLWLPSLRTLDIRWLTGFMALTAGLLTFLAIDALLEGLELQATLPGALSGVGLSLIGMVGSFLALGYVAERLTRKQSSSGLRPNVLHGAALATMVAIGIGLHNFGEGLAIGSSFALGELALGGLLVVGFTVHNITEGLGIVAPVADAGERPGLARLISLAMVAGLPAIPGAWIGGFVTSDLLGALFFSIAAGAALQVVFEVARYVRQKVAEGAGTEPVALGFVGGLTIMYVTGLLIG